MKNNLFACFFLFLATAAPAQALHEVKADFILPAFRATQFAYEFMPTKSIGIEGGVRYRWAADADYYVPFSKAEPALGGSFIHTHQQIVIFNAAFKYYFFQMKPGSGWHIGAYLRDDLLTSPRNAQYTYLLLEGYNWAGVTQKYTRQLRFGAGLLLGYKYLIGRHWLLEASLGGDVDLLHREQLRDFASLGDLRVGYRF